MTTDIKKTRVTPSMAKKLLADTTTRNRPLARRFVTQLTRAIINGEWQDNAETIKLDRDGNVIDGQHRLAAIVESGRTVTIWVARGMDPSAFSTIDQGKVRTLADVLAVNGEMYYAELGGALHCFASITKRIDRQSKRLTNPAGLALLAKFPGLRNSVSYIICDCELKRLALISCGRAAGLHFRMTQKDKNQADKFWYQVGTGEKLSRKSAAWKLRDVLITNKSAIEKLSSAAMTALVIKAWNAYRDGANFNRRLVPADLEASIK